MSLDNEDAGNAAFLGNRQIGISGRKYKLRKADGQISEVSYRLQSLINTVFSGGYKAFGAFIDHKTHSVSYFLWIHSPLLLIFHTKRSSDKLRVISLISYIKEDMDRLVHHTLFFYKLQIPCVHRNLLQEDFAH